MVSVDVAPEPCTIVTVDGDSGDAEVARSGQDLHSNIRASMMEPLVPTRLSR